jgi:hypothetical protein
MQLALSMKLAERADSLTDGRDKTNTSTRNQTTNNHDRQVGSSGFEDTSDTESEASGDNSPTSTNSVRDISRDDSTEKGTAGKNTGKKRLLPTGEDESSDDLFRSTCGRVLRKIRMLFPKCSKQY